MESVLKLKENVCILCESCRLSYYVYHLWIKASLVFYYFIDFYNASVESKLKVKTLHSQSRKVNTNESHFLERN